MTYRVLVTDPLSEDGLTPLKNQPNIQLKIKTNLTNDELLKEIKAADALFIRSQTNVTAELLDCAENLKFIGRAGVGVDNIDLDACTKRGIVVVNAPGGNTNSAAEHTIAMLFSLSRNIPQAYQSLLNKEWRRGDFIGVEVKNKTLGVIGLGKIGEEVAKRAQGEKMNVIGYDPFLTEERALQLGIQGCTLEKLFQKSDYITVHTPLIPQTKHLIDESAFQMMKDGVRILNCARGGIIKEAALIDALKSGKVAGAALDVFEEEPPFSSELLTRKDTIVTPHLGGSTIEAQQNVAKYISEDYLRFITGKAVLHPINTPTIPIETAQRMEPFVNLSNQIGHFISLQVTGAIKEIEIQFNGSITDSELSLLVRSTCKGILKRYFGDDVNDVNALYLAEQKQITIHERKSSIHKTQLEELTILVKTNKGDHVEVSGTTIPLLGTRITNINGYDVNLTPKGHLIIIHHTDRPGAIGSVGEILGRYGLNIGTMQVDRKDVGAEAMMLLTIDKTPEKDILNELRLLDFIKNIHAISF